jgi:transposase IS481 family protein
MRLHGNAALSLNKRKLLVHRVMEEDWSLSEAARAAEVSERTARKWAFEGRRATTLEAKALSPEPRSATTPNVDPACCDACQRRVWARTKAGRVLLTYRRTGIAANKYVMGKPFRYPESGGREPGGAAARVRVLIPARRRSLGANPDRLAQQRRHVAVDQGPSSWATAALSLSRESRCDRGACPGAGTRRRAISGR